MGQVQDLQAKQCGNQWPRKNLYQPARHTILTNLILKYDASNLPRAAPSRQGIYYESTDRNTKSTTYFPAGSSAVILRIISFTRSSASAFLSNVSSLLLANTSVGSKV